MIVQEPAPIPGAPAAQPPGERVIHPWQDFDAVLRHARRARAAGDLARACTFYTRALDLNPNSAEAWQGRASTTSNLDDAIVAWGYALALAPDNEARAMLGACVSEKIKRGGAAQVESIVTVGRRLAEAGQWQAAHRLLVQATELAASNEEAWMWRAGVSEDVSETTACLKRALEINPQNAHAKAGLQWVAQRAPENAPAIAPERAAAAVDEGQRALQTGDRARAHECFVRATQSDAGNASAWFWRGSTASEIDEALDCMEHVLAIDPQNEAAKDARWWLRVQKLRARAPALASAQPKPPALDPYAERYPRKNNRPILFAAFFLAAMLVCGLLALLIVLRLAGYL